MGAISSDELNIKLKELITEEEKAELLDMLMKFYNELLCWIEERRRD